MGGIVSARVGEWVSEWVRQLSGVRPEVIRGVKINSQMAHRVGVLGGGASGVAKYGVWDNSKMA